MTSSGQTTLTLVIPSSTVDDCGQFVCEGRSGELLRMATGNLLVTGELIIVHFNIKSHYITCNNKIFLFLTRHFYVLFFSCNDSRYCSQQQPG